VSEFIREAIVSTLHPDGRVHLTPLGYRMRGELVLLAPYHPSQTLQNLRGHGHAVLNFTDDVRVIAGCLTGRRDWPTVASARVPVPRLAELLAHWEHEAVELRDDATRPEFACRVLARQMHAPFTGYNRAQAAVLEASVLVSRLDWLDPPAVIEELLRLRVAVDKTASARELEAWSWLIDAIGGHPRHAREAGRLSR
jgi:hypothetical protein